MERLMICNQCEEIFPEDEAEYEDRGQWVPWQEGYAYEDIGARVCPYCGSDDIENYYGDDEEDEDDKE